MKIYFLIFIFILSIKVSYQQLRSHQSLLNNDQRSISVNNFYRHLYASQQNSYIHSSVAASQRQTEQNLPKYICSIQYNENEECKCVITSKTTVVTAAHCAYEKNAIYYQVVIQSNYENTYKIINSTYKHFIYQYPYFNDIIELTLNKPISIDAQIVQIPSEEDCNKFPYGKDASIWILNDKNSNLNEIHVKILNNNDLGCKNYVRSRKIIQTMFCAGWNDGRIDPCKAPDGSPLIFNNKLYGIASWGKGCKRPTQASVYVNYCKFAYDYRNYKQEEDYDYANED